MYGVKQKKLKFPYLNSSPTTCRPLNGKNIYCSVHNNNFYTNRSIARSANSAFIAVKKQHLKLSNFLTNGASNLPSLPSCRVSLRRFRGADLPKHCWMFILSKAKNIGFCKLSAVLPNLLEKSTNSRLLT